MGILTLLLVAVAIPLTISTLQKPQEIRQHAQSIPDCATDDNSIRSYLGPLVDGGNSCGIYADYYCRSDSYDAITNGDIPNDPSNPPDIRAEWGQMMKDGRVTYHNLKYKYGAWSGPAAGYYLRTDGTPWSFGRSVDNWGLLQPTDEARNDIHDLMKAGSIIVEGVCGQEPSPTDTPTPSDTPTITPTPSTPQVYLPPHGPQTIDFPGLFGNTQTPVNPTSGNSNILGTLVIWLLALAIILAILFILWQAIRWITSGGDEEKIKKAKAGIVYAVLGLIVALISFAIVIIIGKIFGVSLIK